MKNSIKGGFALIEILIAITILSIVVISLYSGVSTGSAVIAQNKNMTLAIMIAKNKLTEFKLEKMRGTDIKDEPIENYPGFTYTREIKRYENEMLGPIPAKIVVITVNWKQNISYRAYSISYVYAEK